MVGRNIARRAFGNGRARHPVRPARRPGPGSRCMQRGSAGSHGLGGGDGLRGPLYMRRPRLPCGLLLWEARRGARACGGSRTRRRGRCETCGPWHTGRTCPLGRGCRRWFSRSAETSLNNYYPPTCVHPMERPSHACPHPARACIVLPRAAPRRVAARTPRTGYCGRRRRSDRPFRTGFIRWLEEEEILSQAPVFHEFLESISFFQLLKSLFGRRVRSWLRTNAGGAPNTCKSRG